MKFATPKNSGTGILPVQLRAGTRQARRLSHCAAFTLAEVLAAMLFLAIVIPAAVEAMHLASLAGEVAARKGAAARVADRILNESLVTTNWGNGTQSGTTSEGALDLRWTLTSQSWPQDSAMQVVTAEVKFTAQGKDYSVKLNTLAAQPGVTTMNLTK
jgi:Tfp pilus assembly protein PilV